MELQKQNIKQKTKSTVNIPCYSSSGIVGTSALSSNEQINITRAHPGCPAIRLNTPVNKVT